MKRLLAIAFLGLLSALAISRVLVRRPPTEVYYTLVSSNFSVFAVGADGGTPRTVIGATELTAHPRIRPSRPGRFQHTGAPVFAGLVREGSRGGKGGELNIFYRDTTGALRNKEIAALAAQAAVPYGHRPAHDDRFISFVAREKKTGNSFLYRLNVSVPEFLSDGYVPPTTYDDSRLELVFRSFMGPTSGNLNPMAHAWSPAGDRVAIHDFWQRPDGQMMHSFRVKRLADGATTLLHEQPYPAEGDFDIEQFNHIDWNPVDDRILLAYAHGGLFTLHADSPGKVSRVLTNRNYQQGDDAVTDMPHRPRWGNDGKTILFSLVREIESPDGSKAKQYFLAKSTGEWPARLLAGPLKEQPIPQRELP